MKQAILRNIAIVSALFAVAFSVMLITTYFQVRGATPLQTEVVETLKGINDQNANNPALQEQIRRLDLMARKAYFVRMDHLMIGVYILLGMLAVFVVSTRLYFTGSRNIPEKELSPVDEWMVKSRARSYVVWGTSGLAAAGLLFALLGSPYLKPAAPAGEAQPNAILAEAGETENKVPQETAQQETAAESTENGNGESTATQEEPSGDPAQAEKEAEEKKPEEKKPETAAEKALLHPPVASVPHSAFRGNHSDGHSPAKRIPVKWDLASGTNIAWKQEVPKQGYNSPVICNGKVFFSGADEQARELYCYDLATGKHLWSLAAANIPGSPAQMPETTEDTGLAASGVAANGKQVCAVFATGDILCADMNGKQLWARNLGVPDNHYGYASSLLIFDNTVIVQYDNANTPRVLALDLATGAERWSKSRAEKVTWSSPVIAAVDNTPRLILMGNPAITAYNPANGEQLWRVECMTGEVGASACSADGVIFGASEYAKLVAIDGADGKILWEANDFLPEVSSPVATKDNLYLATSYGVVAAYDAKTGTLRKEHELNTEFYSSPMIAEGRIYLFSNDGKMHLFSADSEFRLLDSFETGERTFATPAFTDGKIVVRTEKSIYCVAAADVK
ncbi:MAG: PQQ-binding-like beta-propeller repeat protein [Culturomica sp.]|jgi:outer membrane protein assembly factor BamB|nr:PQQ-binding-like beta-propeller repeat protein [Culturomica sp.]